MAAVESVHRWIIFGGGCERYSMCLKNLTLFIEDAFIDIDDNIQLCKTVCAGVRERLRQCVSVEGKYFEHFRRSTHVSTAPANYN
jgi:hypothetical protein